MDRPIYECIAYDTGSELEDLKIYKKDLEKYTDFLESEQTKQLAIQGVMPLFSLPEIEGRLRTQIECNISEDEHSISWGNQEGVLISKNDALVILRLLENKA